MTPRSALIDKENDQDVLLAAAKRRRTKIRAHLQRPEYLHQHGAIVLGAEIARVRAQQDPSARKATPVRLTCVEERPRQVSS